MTQLPMVRTSPVPGWVSCVAQITVSLFESKALMGEYEGSMAAHWERKIRGFQFRIKRGHTSASMPHMLTMLKFKVRRLDFISLFTAGRAHECLGRPDIEYHRSRQ